MSPTVVGGGNQCTNIIDKGWRRPYHQNKEGKGGRYAETGRNQAWKNFVQFGRYGEKLSGMLIHRENQEDGRGENTGRRRKRVQNEQ